MEAENCLGGEAEIAIRLNWQASTVICLPNVEVTMEIDIRH